MPEEPKERSTQSYKMYKRRHVSLKDLQSHCNDNNYLTCPYYLGKRKR